MTVFHGAKRGFEGLTVGKCNETAMISSAKALRAKLSMTFVHVVRNGVRRSDMKRLRNRQKKTEIADQDPSQSWQQSLFLARMDSA